MLACNRVRIFYVKRVQRHELLHLYTLSFQCRPHLSSQASSSFHFNLLRSLVPGVSRLVVTPLVETHSMI